MSLTVLSVGYPLATVSESTAGGAEQILLTLDRALVEAGHRSIVVAPADSRCQGLLVPVYTPTTNFSEPRRREAQHQCKRSLEWALDHYPVDIVHLHGLDFDQYLPKTEIPIVVSLHLPLAWYPPRALRREHSRMRLIAVSASQMQAATEPVQIAAIIPNGIDLKRFHPAHERGEYALILGRICPEKGIHLALDAAERANLPVILAGAVFDYPEHQRYFQQTIQPRLSARVRFVGTVGGKRKAHLLGGARCLLVPSLAPETSCLVAMEALAAGTPVVAWRSGALPDIVQHERTGFLVSSVTEMADAVSSLATIDRVNCRREAERRFSAQSMISRYFDLYRESSGQTTADRRRAA
ncbi:MAG: glycosyltransferase family 4 protein [Acidobacteria bacterium]|nr:glycosyltransferase family 4 protein [Acidobacteriota bacterium]